MARYYDMDKLKEMIEAKTDTLVEGKEAFLYVANWLDLLPSADVVPKSEVEKIFEDIEKMILDNTYPDFDVNHKPVNVWKATTGYDSFYELKKKYTEGKT